MVNANLFSIKHPFTWHRRRFIAVSPIKKRILKCMYICTYVCTYVHTMYIWFNYICLENTKTKKIKATATFYDLCVLRNLKSSEQYFSAKWAIIDTPTVCTQWPQNFFCSFLAYEYSKFAEFYADFKSVEIIEK
jgi:hypothetical protein